MIKHIFLLFFYISTALLGATVEAEEHHHEKAVFCIKCGTPQIMRSILLGTAKIAARPDMDTSKLSSLNHFRVHYDTTLSHAPDLTDNNKSVDMLFIELLLARVRLSISPPKF